MPMTMPSTPVAVRVRAPARLHLGFLDPAATLGRRFGSLGLAIEGFDTVVDMARSEATGWPSWPAALATDRAIGADLSDQVDAVASHAAALPRLRDHLAALRRESGATRPVRLALVAAPPPHAGFGSGTQLALATGRAFATLFEQPWSTLGIAALLGRGARSGVGVAAFDAGGLLLDGGPRADGSPAALLSRVPLPPAWRVVVVLDPRLQGLSGPAERAALAVLPPLPVEASAEICHEVLMRVLPGAAGAEFAPFAAGVTRVQRVLGGHFAPAQQGRAFTSPAVGRLVDWIAAHRTAAVGQSSWGPAGFAILPSAAEALDAIADATAAGVVDPALELHVTCATDRGAHVEPLPAAVADAVDR
jgi:beta-RFAP synthase